MAPEYAMHGHFSVKTDVYSFGVLVLDIVTGQRNNHIRRRETIEDLLSYVSIMNSSFAWMLMLNNAWGIGDITKPCL